ncbi:MAG: hypothetical protein Q9191_001557 [Dirinaria sp. TL-2023a]
MPQNSPKRSPDQRNWKNSLCLSEVPGVVGGRLPPIVEDKYYPRQTLESEELHDLLNATNAVGSPDLGPPPVVSWQDSDSVKNESVSTSPVRERDAGSADHQKLPLLANLETRKKRRESTQHSASERSMPRDFQSTQRLQPSEVSTQPLKAGAKRKLNARDDQTKNESINALKENCVLDPKTEAQILDADQPTVANTDDLLCLDTSRSRARGTGGSREKDNESLPAITDKPRQVLAPKSVNADPLQSPAKAKKAVVDDKVSDGKHSTNGKPRDRNRSIERPLNRKHERRRDDTHEQVQSPGKVADEASETPAATPRDHALPQSEPSAVRPGSRDTPPPPDLNHETSAAKAFELAGRATRRPRGTVSYAEPSLRDKMRRPTKELVDAVGADDRPQIIKVQQKPTESGYDTMQRMIVKQENLGDDENWKTLPIATKRESQKFMETEPTSPRTSKSNPMEGHPPMPVAGHPEECSMSIERSERTARAVSNAGSTIAALVSGTHNVKKREDKAAMKTKESKDIFELRSSSPNETTMAVATMTGPIRGSRRHSSISANVDAKTRVTGSDGPASRRGERRRESTRPASTGPREGEYGVSELKSISSVADLVETGMTRAERAASRRKSMML